MTMPLDVDKIHLTESLMRLGGVETLVQQLLRGDPGSHAAALLDQPNTGVEKGVGLRAGKYAGAFLVRRAARARYARAKYLIFHNFCGIMMLSAALPHQRKCLFLHTNSADVFSLLPRRLPYLDTIIVSGQALENEILEKFPDITVPITAVEYPLDDRYFRAFERVPGPTLILGYSGRLELEQKQVLRLVDLCAALTALAMPFRLEIAGSGNAMGELQRRLPAEHCCFLGVLNAAGLQAAYQRWDFLICTSDYETGPLVALEAMATGAIPILPDIPCQATALTKDLDLALYPPGDMTAASHLIRTLVNMDRLDGLRAKLIAKVADRRLPRFVNKINTVLAEASERPALGGTPAIPKGLAEYLPFSIRKSGNDYLR